MIAIILNTSEPAHLAVIFIALFVACGLSGLLFGSDDETATGVGFFLLVVLFLFAAAFIIKTLSLAFP